MRVPSGCGPGASWPRDSRTSSGLRWRFCCCLELLIFGALSSMPDEVDDASVFGVLLLAVVSAFVQIALTLAASSQEQRTADEWVKLAFRRGVFWRLILTSFVTFAAILLGLLALIVGGLVLGGMLGLSQTAAIQERAWPVPALRSSVALSRGHRVTIGTIFAITFIVPNAFVQAGTELRVGSRTRARLGRTGRGGNRRRPSSASWLWREPTCRLAGSRRKRCRRPGSLS